MMKKAFIYIMAASSDPNVCEKGVPYKIDSKEIFYGPCKRRLRQKLRMEYLMNSNSVIAIPEDDIYFVGMNASNNLKIRKIIWVGRIKRIMSFETAYNKLKAKKYDEMRSDPHSPLHLKPIYDNKLNLIGYEFLKTIHNYNDDWVFDIVNTIDDKIIIKKNSIFVREKYSIHDTLNRDICFIFENIFVAHNGGIEIDKKIMGILKDAQSGRSDLNNYSVFGKQSNGYANGKRGSWLELNDDQTDLLISIVKERANEIKSSYIQRVRPMVQNNSCKPKNKSC